MKLNQAFGMLLIAAAHNIGIAIATNHGLVVPNIKNVQKLSVLELVINPPSLLHLPHLFIVVVTHSLELQIATELSRLIQLANTNSLSTDDITGGTITVSNFGAIGGKFGLPVLNVPEVAIVAIGRMQQVVRMQQNELEQSQVVNVSISESPPNECCYHFVNMSLCVPTRIKSWIVLGGFCLPIAEVVSFSLLGAGDVGC